MIEGGSFSITNTLKPTNQNIVVAFSPAQNIKTYSYTLYKDNIAIQTQNITINQPANITLTETGTYQITVKTYDEQNKETTINSGTYIVDKEAPVLTVTRDNIQISKGEALPNNMITANDNYDGDITSQITNNASKLNLNSAGEKTLTYTISDEAGNVATKNININVIDNSYYLVAVQMLILAFVIAIIYLSTKFSRSLRLVKRIEPFTIPPLKNNEPSLLDKIFNWYQQKLIKWEHSFNKSVIVQKYSKKLEKYKTISTVHQNGSQIFISKCVAAILLIIVAVVVKAIQFKLLEPYEILLPLLVGFFLLDIVYFVKYKVYRNKLENDLLSAIIVMNNAFKAGRSIVQAIDVVSKELEGEIAREFSKMSLELSYGLEIDTVFKRFADRIKLEEVNYLTASLTILNKTGGNIIEVFSSIEKTLFNKKKLRLELKSLTTSSRIIIYVLFTVPFLFILFVSIISPGYFAPFITTDLGLILTIIMIVYYLLFIICVRKIMKVVI